MEDFDSKIKLWKEQDKISPPMMTPVYPGDDGWPDPNNFTPGETVVDSEPNPVYEKVVKEAEAKANGEAKKLYDVYVRNGWAEKDAALVTGYVKDVK